MKTEDQNNNFQELDRRVEQLLSPRFAPSAEEVKLPTPRPRKSPVWLNMLRIGGVAAAIIVGILFVIEPTNEVTAKTSEVIAEALDALQNADAFSVDFRMKATINHNGDETEYYKCDPNGEDIEGTLTLLKSSGKEYMRIEWSSGIVQLFDGGDMRYRMWQNGELKCDMENRSFVFKLLQLASLGGAKAIIKTADVSMNIEESGDNTVVKAVNEDKDVELEGVFSRQNGELLECGARTRLGNKEWVKVLSAKIKYNQPITVEQICAAPNK
ncbi:MAG: hypothetical protein IJ288_04570 [Alistipes sp.]|nr:hypothetical protein [Alistipes sp.]